MKDFKKFATNYRERCYYDFISNQLDEKYFQEEELFSTNINVIEATKGLEVFYHKDGKVERKMVHPPSDRKPLTSWHNNGMWAFTDSENRYYICNDQSKILAPTIEVPMCILCSNGEVPTNSFMAAIIGK